VTDMDPVDVFLSVSRSAAGGRKLKLQSRRFKRNEKMATKAKALVNGKRRGSSSAGCSAGSFLRWDSENLRLLKHPGHSH